MFPLALANLIVTAVVVWVRGMSAREPRSRTRASDYWNEPTMAWWERAYLFEILRGLAHHRRRVPAQHVASG